jgi:pilus assembly protein Flp/PilA
MEHFRLMLATLTNDKRAVTALEYGMIAALIALVVIGGFTTIGTKLSTTLSTLAASNL